MKERLIKVLNSDSFYERLHEKITMMEEFNADNIPEGWEDKDKYIQYYKAFCLYQFENKYTSPAGKEIYVKRFEQGQFECNISDFKLLIKAVSSDFGDLIYEDSEFNEMLSEYFDDPLYDRLSEYDKEIAEKVIEYGDFKLIDDLKKGNYSFPYSDDYKLSDEEIECIEKAKESLVLGSLIHLTYDECHPDGNFYPSFNKVNSSNPFYTGKSSPEMNILFNDGTIMYYYNGHIRIKDIKFSDFISFVKLFFVLNYREDFLGDMLGDESETGLETDFETMDNLFENKSFLLQLEEAFNDAYGRILVMDDRFSKKMIDDSNKSYSRLKELIKENKL